MSPNRPLGQDLHATVRLEVLIVSPNLPGGQPIVGQEFDGGSIVLVTAFETRCPKELVHLKVHNTPELFGRFMDVPLKGMAVPGLDAHNCTVVLNGTIEAIISS